MRTLKSFWFWFLVVWIVVGVAATWILAVKLPAWPWWCTLIAVAWFAIGAFVALFLRQRQLIRTLSKGSESRSTDQFEEVWKSGFASDVRKLSESSSTKGVQIGVKSDDLAQKRIFWVVPSEFDSAKALLEASGARDVTESRRHELSGEFQNLGNWLVFRDMVFVLLRELPDARVASTVSRASFLIEYFQQRGKMRPVDGALVLAPIGRGLATSQIHATVSFLAETSLVEFPVYVGLTGAEQIPGGASFFKVASEVPGVALSWTKQENLPAAFDKAWTELESDLDAKEDGLLAMAWERGEEPASSFQFLESLRGLKDAVKSTSLACSSQFVGRTVPFLRGAYLVPSGKPSTKSDSPSAPAADPAAMLFGSAVFEDSFSGSSSPFGAPAPAPAPSDTGRDPTLESFFELLQKDPPLARLASHKQVKSSVLALSVFVGAILISLFLMWSALHGWVVGASLEDGWKARLQRAKSTPWTDAESMRSAMAVLSDMIQLSDEIDNRRPWLLAPGFYRDGMLPKVEAQIDSMASAINQLSFQNQEYKLKTLLFQSYDSSSDTKDIYGALKIYLLTTREGWAEGSDKEGEKGLSEAMLRSWGDYLGYGQALPAFERELLPKLTERISEKISDGDSSWLAPQDRMLVENARRGLRNAKNQSGTYARLLAAADTLPKFDWDSLGIPQKEVTCKPMVIGGAFTRRGWIEAISPTLNSMDDGETDWVVGKSDEPEAVGQASSEEVLKELRRRYVEEFVATWRGLLDSSSCQLPAENQRIGSALHALSAPYTRNNPKGIQAFFARFLEETDLTPPPDTSKPILTGKLAKTVKKVEKIGAMADRVSSAILPQDQPVHVQVATQLAAIRTLSKEVGKGTLDAYTKDLAQLGSMFSQWTGGEGAFAFAKGVAGQDPRNPLVHAWNEAASRKEALPAELRPWFDAFTIGMLRQIAGRALPQASGQANVAYREKVWQPWQNLTKGAYPFDPYAENEASINDIDAFLNPRTGTFALFLKEMEGLVTVQGDDIRTSGANGMGVSIDPQAVEQLRKLIRMSNYFYGKGGTAWKGVGTSVTLRGDAKARITFRIGTQSVDLAQGGEKRLAFRWPKTGQAGLTLTVSTINQTFEERKEGDWALLRFMESKGAGTTEGTWSFNDRSYIVDVPISVRLDQPGGPFSDREFFHVSLVPDPFR
ncbi:MAG TPA: ImcF-related family protein [Fibrobacteria bacterium]|mgnify:CR=1 FL=1|nr:ImcF-related family protein [Fibrobacteria bacterium]